MITYTVDTVDTVDTVRQYRLPYRAMARIVAEPRAPHTALGRKLLTKTKQSYFSTVFRGSEKMMDDSTN